MLTGYLKCESVHEMIGKYINLELKRKDMYKVAKHLRNCPKCKIMYSKMQKRKKNLQTKLIRSEKIIKRQDEVSAYMDNEMTQGEKFYIEDKLITRKKYQKELKENEEVSKILNLCFRETKRNAKTLITSEIIGNIEKKERKRKRLSIVRLFRLLYLSLAK